jgi:hypothetical protein
MPLRPNSHRVAEAATQEFDALKPKEWVSRVKSSDYGVDLEVEIFSPDGHDTGLTFNVQSKGTSKENLEKSVPITLETLKYLCSFDVPAIIFRHSEASGRSYWMWADEALAKAKPGAKRIAVKFTDENLWTTLTPARLEKSVRYRRAIKERGRWTRFPICASSTSADEEIRFSAISGELTSALPFLDAHKGLDGIEISVEIAGDELIVSVSDILIHREGLGSNNPQTQGAVLAYSVLKILSDLKFEGQAERVAEHCLRERLVAPGRVLACDASIALLRSPKSAVDLAMLNNLEKDSDWTLSEAHDEWVCYPFPRSMDPNFFGQVTNAAFASDLSDLIARRRPSVWIHGHIHKFRDYMADKTRVICNPRGYSRERDMSGSIEGFVIDL